MVYLALGAKGHTWNGICRPPWLETLAEAENFGTWGGGGHFATPRLLYAHAWRADKPLVLKSKLPFAIEPSQGAATSTGVRPPDDQIAGSITYDRARHAAQAFVIEFLGRGRCLAQGRRRHCRKPALIEEAGASFELGELFTMINVAKVGQVHFFYRARLLTQVFDPGHETMEAQLFGEADIPWDDIAFKTVKETLEMYFSDEKAGSFGFHATDIN